MFNHKVAHHLSDNIEGSAGAALATIAGSMLGFLSVNNVFETAVLSIVGAVLGFYINKLLKWLHKR